MIHETCQGPDESGTWSQVALSYPSQKPGDHSDTFFPTALFSQAPSPVDFTSYTYTEVSLSIFMAPLTVIIVAFIMLIFAVRD